jgi:hypothetical protein
MKICTKCKEEKPFEAFSKCSKAKDGYKYSCKQCTSIYNKTTLKEWKVAYDKMYRETRMTDSQKDSKREYMRMYQREYTKKNPDWNCAHASARRAEEFKATPRWADKTSIRKFYKEAADRTKTTGEKYEVDHIVPLKSEIVCGLHCEQNLQVIKKNENASKGNRWWPDMP